MFESEHINYKGRRHAPGDTNPIAIQLNQIEHGSTDAFDRCATADRQNANAHAGAFVHVRPVTAINTRCTINPALSGTNRSVPIGTPAMVCDRPTTSRIIATIVRKTKSSSWSADHSQVSCSKASTLTTKAVVMHLATPIRSPSN
jgi:hypothetical protein